MEAQTPGDEFQIAGAGPVMSVAIAFLLGGAWWAGTQLGWHPAIPAVLQYIALLNVILAVFNLLPGFPLDGGRLFRAAVWKVTGDVHRATRVASTGGRWLAYVLIAFGLMSAFGGNVMGGIWMVFIGWFLRNAAISSYQQHTVLSMLSGVRASQAMTANPETVPADATVRELIDEYFMRRRFSAYPVTRNGSAVGIVTLDATRSVPRDDWDLRTASDVMSPADEGLVVRPDDNLVVVMERLRASSARRLLVVRDGELVGIITAGDVGFWLQQPRQQ
jgi:CBS domain-containing protein